MANEPGKIDRQKAAASGKDLPVPRQIAEISGVIAPLTMFGTAVAWVVAKAAVEPVRT
ncbi:hypothetical protein GG804_00485 [Sphingomonas histidinilytica]|uniref:hypothetical protein n=1 Tax=Rhizorhabdus histidinilytica TaxID=439228 RepID=UPI0015917BEF|nr:hypothetical protein [Rhizorhabdus histidinilytica]MBO9375232.1 hypothetical protein [Rhizorhabdus histidinilytica]